MKKNKKISLIYNMYKEQILYLVFGVLTTAISIVVYWLFTECIKLDILFANVISWIIAVAFAFITNRIWVFETDKNTPHDIFIQLFSFYGGRLLTLLIEELILWIFITLMHLPNMWVKLAAQIVIIVLNYIISKFMIFRKK